MGGGQNVAHGGSPEDPPPVVVIRHGEGQVGAPTGDQLKMQVTVDSPNSPVEPPEQVVVVDPRGVGHRPGTVVEAHDRLPTLTSMDVTDATFQTEVIDRSRQVPVVVDLWAEWCGPCTALGPILEKVVGETGGQVVLAKVDIDKNPGVAQAFQVQSIPAVFGLVDGQVAGSFVGAQGEEAVRAFVEGLLPTEEVSEMERLVAAGDEASLIAALAIENDNVEAVTALALLLVERSGEGDREAALQLLERIPESAETRRIAAMARVEPVEDVETTLGELLLAVKDDDEARQRFVDLLEVLGPDDPRTAEWRRRLTSTLF